MVAIVMAVVYLGCFFYCLSRRRWTWPGLLVGMANIFIAFLVSVAPIRGWADPDYLGFSFGLFYASPGPGVTLVAGSILVLATYAACVAVLNRHGLPMRVVAIFDAVMALNIGGSVLMTLLQDPQSRKIQLGEYITIGPAFAALILVLLIFLPMTVCAIWAWRRSSTANGPANVAGATPGV